MIGETLLIHKIKHFLRNYILYSIILSVNDHFIIYLLDYPCNYCLTGWPDCCIRKMFVYDFGGNFVIIGVFINLFSWYIKVLSLRWLIR